MAKIFTKEIIKRGIDQALKNSSEVRDFVTQSPENKQKAEVRKYYEKVKKIVDRRLRHDEHEKVEIAKLEETKKKQRELIEQEK